MNFNEITTRRELADFLGFPINKLTYILYVKNPDSFYVTFTIPKKNGDPRIIHSPQGSLKDVQQKLLIALSAHVKQYNLVNSINENISHAFTKEKSIITNASHHINKRSYINISCAFTFLLS